MYMRSDGKYLTGLWFKDSRDSSKHIGDHEEKNLPVFEETGEWLDIYFSGKIPDFTPEYKVENLTPFRQQVIDIMNKIPYGKVTTYHNIAAEIAKIRGLEKNVGAGGRRSGRLESNMHRYTVSQSCGHKRKSCRLRRRYTKQSEAA